MLKLEYVEIEMKRVDLGYFVRPILNEFIIYITIIQYIYIRELGCNVSK